MIGFYIWYRATAFLIGAACAEHSLSKVGSIFLHIRLAFAFTKDWNLKWKWPQFSFTGILKVSWRKSAPKERESEKRLHLNFFEPIRSEVWFSQSPTYQWPNIKARLKGSWFSQVTFPNPLPNVCGLSHVGDLVKFSPAIIPSDPSKLCPWEGRHTGGNATRSTCSPIQQTLLVFL